MVTPSNPDRVSVCVCTFRRPATLSRLIESLAGQVVDQSFALEVVVVDNDRDRPAEATVRAFAARTGVATIYDCEPEQNISLTRNRAIRNATGNAVAFIDDDEWPTGDWLARLYHTLRAHDADGVFGPVLPDFPADAPHWLTTGSFFRRRRVPTGTRVSMGDARTGNVLMWRSVFADGEPWFDPAFGRTGGEDSEFFWRQLARGRGFVWCDEAVVYEAVPPERWKATFHLRRLLRAGTLDGELMRDGRLPSKGRVARNAAILCGCIAVACPSLLLPKRLWMRVLQKGAYCIGVVTAYFGCSMLRYRD